MKRIYFVLLIVGAIQATPTINTPPTPPTHTTHSKTAHTTDPCRLIPPMLHRLPPLLLEMVDHCHTQELKPTKERVTRRLQNNNYHGIKVLKIEPVNGLSRFYKIRYTIPYTGVYNLAKLINHKEKYIYCEANLNYCFDTPPLSMQ